MSNPQLSRLRKTVGILSWLYVAPLWLWLFLGDQRHVPIIISSIPMSCLIALTLLASFAISDGLLDIAEALKPAWRAWSDRKHFQVTLICTIPMFAVDMGYMNMVRELGTRIGQP